MAVAFDIVLKLNQSNWKQTHKLSRDATASFESLWVIASFESLWVIDSFESLWVIASFERLWVCLYD